MTEGVSRATESRHNDDNHASMTELSGWLNIAEAAHELGTSERSIERRIRAGEIESRKRPRRAKKPETVCNPQDVQRLKPAAFMLALPEAAGQLARTEEKSAAQTALNVLAGVVGTIAAGQRQHGEAEKRWLTLQEASDASGLSERFLRREIRNSHLAAVKDGRKWKIDRKALETWQPLRPQLGSN